MSWLRKLPGFQRTPAGLEWRILKAMPGIFITGTLLPLLMSVGARFWIEGGNDAELARRIQQFDFSMLGLVILIWTLALTVTIGCTVVWLMKGPAYVADGLDVSHSDQPRQD
jgi:hypothetical protein